MRGYAQSKDRCAAFLMVPASINTRVFSPVSIFRAKRSTAIQ